MIKRTLPLCLLTFMLLSLAACSGAPYGAASRTVLYASPLPEPTRSYAELARFEEVSPLDSRVDFIFKGKIEKITEARVSRKEKASGGGDMMLDQWFSVCDVAVGSVLHGGAPGGKDRLKVVFGQSSRGVDPDEFRLLEGREYYFITHLFNADDRSKPNDPVRVYELGDAMGGTFYNLFPVQDGAVSFMGWPFEGAEAVSESIYAVTSTIDEESFLEQFRQIIADAKS